MTNGLYSITGAGISALKTKTFILPEGTTADTSSATSYFGTPVFSNLKIKPFKYNHHDGKQISINNGIQIDTDLISITHTKNIVTTPVQGRNGTEKEYISDGDFQVEIQGKIVSKTDNYPEQDVNELIEICKAPVPIPSGSLISEYLNWFGIHTLVIESYSFPQSEGTRNEQEFSISAISDIPIEFETDEF